MSIENVKKQIYYNLSELQSEGVLKDVMSDNFTPDPFERDFTGYPTAIVSSPTVGGTYLTNGENQREVSYEILIIQNRDNLGREMDSIEQLMTKILDKFDNDPTLSAVAAGGVSAGSSQAVPIVTKGSKSLIVFSILIEARIIVELSFEFNS